MSASRCCSFVLLLLATLALLSMAVAEHPVFLEDLAVRRASVSGSLTGDLIGFASAVTPDGSHIVSAAPNANGGRATVIKRERDGNGDFKVVATYMLVSRQQGSFVGSAAAISPDGSLVLLGAPQFEQSRGCVVVFRRNDELGLYIEDQEPLLSAQATTGSQFGSALALAGDTLVVGAPNFALPSAAPEQRVQTGAAFVFRLTPGASDAVPARFVELGAPLIGRLATENSLVGFSVAISPSRRTIAVSAHGLNKYAGAVFVFVRSENGAAYVEIPNPLRLLASTFLGVALAVDHDERIYATNYNPRSVVVFSPSEITDQHGKSLEYLPDLGRMISAPADASSAFPTSLALTHDSETNQITVAAADFGWPRDTYQGCVFVFETSLRTGRFELEQTLVAAGTSPSMQTGVGFSVAITADAETVVVGAIEFSDPESSGADRTGATIAFNRVHDDHTNV